MSCDIYCPKKVVLGADKMFKLIVSSLLLSSVFAQNHPLCGQKVAKNPISDNYVVGGVNTDPLEFPWQVSLQYLSDSVGWYHTCGGSVIGDEWILTAAHCVDRSLSGSMYRVIIGEHDRSKVEGTESTLNVVKVIQHPSWDSNNINNDVAILKLDRKINFSGNESYIRPVCLPDKTSNLDDIVGTQCIATGWGNTQWQGTSPNILQKVAISIWQQATCRSRYALVISITNGMICFGENGKGTCQGDSGGPLNCQVGGKWYTYGATSFGVQCAGPTYPSVSARNSEFSDWIWQTAAAN